MQASRVLALIAAVGALGGAPAFATAGSVQGTLRVSATVVAIPCSPPAVVANCVSAAQTVSTTREVRSVAVPYEPTTTRTVESTVTVVTLTY